MHKAAVHNGDSKQSKVEFKFSTLKEKICQPQTFTKLILISKEISGPLWHARFCICGSETLLLYWLFTTLIKHTLVKLLGNPSVLLIDTFQQVFREFIY